MIYRPDVAVTDVREPSARAALTIYSTLLGGSMGSRLFDEIREQRGLCYSVYAIDHAFADVPVLQLGSGWTRASASRPTRGCARSSTSCATTGPPRRRSSARAPTPPAGACSPSRTPTPWPAHAAQQTIVYGEEVDPEATIAALDAVTHRRRRRGCPRGGRQARGGVRGPPHPGRVLEAPGAERAGGPSPVSRSPPSGRWARARRGRSPQPREPRGDRPATSHAAWAG